MQWVGAMPSDEHEQADAAHFRSVSEVLTELGRLAHEPGFVYTLAHAAARDTFIGLGPLRSPYERLSVRELTLAAGLLSMQAFSAGDIPDEKTLTAQIKQFYPLLQKLHDVVAQPMTEGTLARMTARLAANCDESDVPDVRRRAIELVEPFFYVGTGAYDFQYLDLAVEKYRYDSEWFANNVGLSIDVMVNAADELRRLREVRFRAYLQATAHEETCKAALAIFTFKRNDLRQLSDDQFDTFIDKFAVTPGEVGHRLNNVGAVNELEFKPIMRLGQSDFFMPVGFKLAEAIYESPFFWMAGDEDYEDQAAENRGRATEEIAARLLSPVFGERLNTNAVVLDGTKTVHEIDVVALVGNRALAIQAKAKRLTVLSRQGNDQQLAKDFSQAVQEAYEQGLVSRRLLLGREHSLLDSDGNPIYLPESIEDAYVICLTLDHFPALTSMINIFLEKQPGTPYPVAMSVFDLDMLATYLTDSFEFTHYIHQRVRWTEPIIGSCEASFLASYLKEGLTLPKEVGSSLLTESMSGMIDEDFPTIRGRNQLLSELLGTDSLKNTTGELKNRWRNSQFQVVVDLLKSSPDPQATDALFMLFDLREDVFQYVWQKIEEAMRSCARTGQISYCCILLEDGSGISSICSPVPESPSTLEEIVGNHADVCKYKYKANKWLGLGIVTTPILSLALAFVREPWEPDPELDKLARAFFQAGTKQEKPGRNQPCWCGSGRKYKSCHL